MSWLISLSVGLPALYHLIEAPMVRLGAAHGASVRAPLPAVEFYLRGDAYRSASAYGSPWLPNRQRASGSDIPPTIAEAAKQPLPQFHTKSQPTIAARSK